LMLFFSFEVFSFFFFPFIFISFLFSEQEDHKGIPLAQWKHLPQMNY
jgi:hypothetical protein